MKYCGIETKRTIKGNDLAKNMIESQFVITTNTCFKFVQEYANEHNIKWNNVFIDEASSIYIKSSDPSLEFQFMWLITNNWLPLLFKNPSLSKKDLYHLKDRVEIMHPDLEEWLLDNQQLSYISNLISSSYFKDYLPFLHNMKYIIILRNNNKFIQDSIQLPIYTTEEYYCRPNITLHSLKMYFLARKLSPMTMIQDKTAYILQLLNIECKSMVDYLQYKPSSVHQIIRRKLNENECIICLEQPEFVIITNCCYNICCAKCILTNLFISGKCPTCREILSINQLCCLKELSKDEHITLQNKTEICLDIVKQHKNGKFIIYSSFDDECKVLLLIRP
jgi:hypothetical protein